MDLFASRARTVSYAPDEDIMIKGELGDAFYVVVHGEAEVHDPDEEEDKEEGDATATRIILSPGNYFGEMALINTIPRTMTVTARTALLCLRIDKEGFDVVFKDAPVALNEFKLRMMLLKAPLITVLLHSVGRVKLREHLTAEMAVESLDFWEAVHDLKINTDGDPYSVQMEAIGAVGEHLKSNALAVGSAEMRNRVRYLYDEYIVGDRQVNISAKAKKQVLQGLQAAEQNTEGAQLDGHIFDRAQSDVQKLMERDGFVRFKKSSLFVDFMKELGIAPAANRKGSITPAAPVAVPQLTSGP